MAVDTETEIIQRTMMRVMPRYRVLLHNDDHNDMNHVIHALVQTVPALSLRQAAKIMLMAHLRGVAQVIVCLKEQAEFYCERLTSFGLTATMEPAG